LEDEVGSVLLPARTVAVWDPAIRVAHWLLVFAFAAAYLTGEGQEEGVTRIVHLWSGYVAGVIVVLRVLWGLIGPRHARFTDFVYRPAKVLRYLFALLRGNAYRYIGHSPAGGAMVVALLLCLAGTVMTGMVANGDLNDVSLAGQPALVRQPRAEHEQDAEQAQEKIADHVGRRAEGETSFVDELHATLANLTLILVVLHVIGVGVASVVHRENLVRAMIDGRKRPTDSVRTAKANVRMT
jgi:cytochrome b